ncbi:DUF1697 domain-containing protein [Mesorhizobium sp. CN5-321]|jgi:uncharacterized protein (DUF1697 family)|uniref:DUF1697 domain-containing protein n=1 Tax=Mesorhizobium hunchu TaxID=3157708 RepID=UPI0032B76B64
MTSAPKTFFALFSGINVGGNRIVKMVELRAFFEGFGFTGVGSYVQSGNVVFRSAKGETDTLAKTIEDAFEARWGFHSRIMVRDAAWLRGMVDANPYADLAEEPKKLHLFVLEREPTDEETKRLSDKCKGPEEFTVRGDAFYLKAPDGIGRSEFAGLIPRTLKVPCTSRNWRTVLALLEMMESAKG